MGQQNLSFQINFPMRQCLYIFFFAIFQYENKKKIEKQNKKENFVGHERHIAKKKTRFHLQHAITFSHLG
jgi:hypothetical protein